MKQPSKKLDQVQAELNRTKQLLDSIVAERVNHEEKLGALQMDLARATAEYESLCYLISHQIRPRVSRALCCLDLLARRVVFSNEDRRFFASAVNSISGLSQTFDHILAFARVDRIRPRFGRTESAVILKSVVRDLPVASAISQSGATIRHSALPPVHSNESLLFLLLQELIENALKFRSQRPIVIDLKAVQHGDTWQFTLRDNGIGFDMQDAGILFGICQRLPNAAKFEGSGMGLAVSKRIVELHGGKIWLESVLDKETTVHFTLPMAKEEMP